MQPDKLDTEAQSPIDPQPPTEPPARAGSSQLATPAPPDDRSALPNWRTEPQVGVNPGSQQSWPDQPPRQSDVFKVRVLGCLLIAIGIVVAVSDSAVAVIDGVSFDVLSIAAATANLLIGIGMLRRAKLAYTAFNVLAILTVIAAIFWVPAAALSLLLVFQLDLPLAYVALFGSGALASLASILVFVVGAIVIHPKRVRRLFEMPANNSRCRSRPF